MQASKEEAKAAVENTKDAAANASAAAKDAATAAAVATKDAAEKASAEAKQTTDKLMIAAKETTHEAATATESAAQQVAASTAPAPTAMPDWIKLPTYDCGSCHRIATKLVGPAWKDVAEKYKGDAGAEARLMEKVRKGGKGNWDKITGGVPMSPHPNISDADLKKVLDFELSLAK
jgi:cytochrome c